MEIFPYLSHLRSSLRWMVDSADSVIYYSMLTHSQTKGFSLMPALITRDGV